MDHPLPQPAGPHASVGTARVIVLHPTGAERIALGLVHAWAAIVPAAVLSPLPLTDGGRIGDVLELVSRKLEWEGVGPSRLVLAGVGGAQDAALQLAFGRVGLGCIGVLALGDGPLPLASLAGQPAPGWPKLRLVWTADDPLYCAAALGGLLHCLRAAGLDAQGAVLARPDHHAGEADSGPSLPLMRLGGAYLGELVAVALASAPSALCPPGTGR